jgi:hypothetical protein
MLVTNNERNETMATKAKAKSASVSSDPLIEKACADVDALSKELAPRTVTLSSSERKRVLKARKGWEGLVPKLANLAQRYGVSLPGVSIDDMLSEMRAAQGISPLVGRVAKLDQSVTDSYLQSQGNMWQSATALYTVLCRAEVANPELETEMAPMRAFFATGPRGAKVGGKSQATDAKASAAGDTSQTAEQSTAASDVPAQTHANDG